MRFKHKLLSAKTAIAAALTSFTTRTKSLFIPTKEKAPVEQMPKAAQLAPPTAVKTVSVPVARLCWLALRGERPEGMTFHEYRKLLAQQNKILRRYRKGSLIFVSSVLVNKKDKKGRNMEVTNQRGQKVPVMTKTKGVTYLKKLHGLLSFTR
jgi:hypothetical protein